MFLRNDAAQVVALRSDAAVRFNGKTPQQLLEDRHWAWHDTPSAWPGQDLELLPGAMTVWTFNGKSGEWGGSNDFSLEIPGSTQSTAAPLMVNTTRSEAWLSAVTFLGPPDDFQPDSMVFHVANETATPLRLATCRLWLPKSTQTWRVLFPQTHFTNLAARDRDASPHERSFVAGGDAPAGQRCLRDPRIAWARPDHLVRHAARLPQCGAGNDAGVP
jgi:hypothetical protein